MVLLELLGVGEYYVFEVCGDLMIEVGIFDGDIVLIWCFDSVDSGDIVVVLVDDEEVMFKWLCKKGVLIVFEVVNLVYEIWIFGLGCVCV